jgi:mRNA-degrading endonuclease RelE of RelBE toxin-antitoxin system
MKIALTEEFLDEMAGLPASVGKGCREAIKELLRSNGKAFRRGMNLEKLKNSAFHTSRINKQYRILLKIDGETFLLCRVGDHDFVYSPHMDRNYSSTVSCQVVRNTPRSLMADRPKNQMNSWVVAATGPGYGRPTKYEEKEIHPECLRQIRDRRNDFIHDPQVLAGWLRAKRWSP